jgi:hypothetical protein
MINGRRQLDGGIVPEKSPNKPKGAEEIEGRPPVEGKAQEHPSPRTQSRTEGMQEVLARIRKAVQKDEEGKLTALYHHVYNIEHLKAAYYQLKKKAAAGVDGETWQHYGQELEANLRTGDFLRRRNPCRCPRISVCTDRASAIAQSCLEIKRKGYSCSNIFEKMDKRKRDFSYSFVRTSK